jgi:transposase
VFAAIDRGIEAKIVAATFTVSVSWIYKVLGRRRKTGETTARPQRCQVPGKLDAHHATIRTQVAAEPDMTIAHLRAWMAQTHGVSVSHAVMWGKLRELQLTLKKRRGMPPSRNGRTSRSRAKSGVLYNPP